MQLNSQQDTGYYHLIAGGMIASLAAGICCLGPLMLLAMGVSGAWMSSLMLLEAYQPILIAITLFAFFLAARRMVAGISLIDTNDCPAPQKPAWTRVSLFVVSLGTALIFLSSEHWIQLLA